ncbi:hypothetical protein DRQ36_08245 [bacterium]|nr:MAG: hypothetical protein DRQ36_08245 [bacterium]
MKKAFFAILMIGLALIAGCKEKETTKTEQELALETALDVIHSRNVLGIREIAMRIDLLDDWGDKGAVKKICKGEKYELAILDPAPLDKPAVMHVPEDWEAMTCKIAFYEKLTGQDILANLNKLVARGEGEEPWGTVEVVSGHPIKEETILNDSWIVPFIFVHDQMLGPLAGIGKIYRIDVILNKDLKLISVIATGGETWVS